MSILTNIISDEVPLDENGFHWRSKGQEGIIYYVENGRLLIIKTRVPKDSPQFDILVVGKASNLSSWNYPDDQKIPANKAEEIHQKLLKWLKARRWNHSFID